MRNLSAARIFRIGASLYNRSLTSCDDQNLPSAPRNG
jgi:hypothetical protein